MLKRDYLLGEKDRATKAREESTYAHEISLYCSPSVSTCIPPTIFSPPAASPDPGERNHVFKEVLTIFVHGQNSGMMNRW